MKGRVRTALALVLSCVMVLGALPARALAVVELEEGDIEYEYNADGEKEKITAVHIDPYTLNCWDEYVDGEELSISNLNNIAQQLSQTWAPIAGAIYEDNTMVTVDSDGDDVVWHQWYGPDVTNGKPDYGGRVDVIDAFKGRSKKNSYDKNDNGEDRYNFDGSWRSDHDDDDSYMTSGLQYATNLNDILLEMCDMSGKTFAGDEIDDHSDYTNARNDKAKILYSLAGKDDKGLGWMKEDAGKSSTQAFYRIVASDNWDDGELYSNNYALIFYDFNLTALGIDEQVGPYTLEEYAGSDNDGVSSEFVENRSQKDSQETFTLTNTTTETVTNTTQESETITHGTNAGIELDAHYGAPASKSWTWTIKAHFSTSWSKAVQTMHSESHAITNTSTNTSTTSVSIPPHAAIAIDKAAGTSTKTLKYNCPTILNYKVAIVSLCWQVGDEDDEKVFSARFGCGSEEGGVHATQNLYKRAVDETTKNRIERPFGQTSGTYDEDDISVSGVNWSSVEKKFPSLNVSDCIQTAATQIPMFTTGMVMTVTTTSNNSYLGNIQPIYPLNEVKLSGGDKRYTMMVGDSMSLAGLKLEGYNAYDVAYFGFKPDKGEWVLCDEEGNEVDSSDVIDLDSDATSGSKEVVAKGAGKAYLKWVIADGVSYKAKEGAEVTRDTKSLVTPIILVTVNKAPTDLTGYSIEAEGEPTVIVGESLDLNGAFNPAVIDPNDKVVSHSVQYETRDESDESPVTIDASGMFVSTKEGDYKVRATYTKDDATITSPWLTVHVAALPQLAVGNTELMVEGGEVHVTLTGEALSDGIEVTLTSDDGSVLTQTAAGTDTRQVAVFSVPANTVFDVDKVYAVACNVGGTNIAEGQTVTVKANTLTHHDAADASCTEDGSIEYWECNETGVLYADENGTTEIAAEDVVVSALGHETVQVEAKDATCTEDGNVAYWACTRCNAVFTDEACEHEVDLADVTIPATGHAWGAWEVTTPATEEAEGVETRTCANDPEHVETRAIDVLPHTHALTHHDAAAATCTEDGAIEYWECTTCGDLFRDEEGAQQITADDISVSATGHTWGAWEVTTPATEEAEGVETRTCETDPTHTETRVIPVATHVHTLTKVDAVAPTCTKAGNIDYWVCSGEDGCGRYFSNESADAELDSTELVVAATGHSWDEGVEMPQATCTTRGVRTFTCTNEGCGATKTESTSALGHAWGEGQITTQPTCMGNGVMTYTCANDSTHTKTEPVDALGHAWDEGEVTTDPACMAKGVRTYRCTRDETHTKQESVPALGHAWDEGIITADPTCTTKGVRTFTCTNDPTHTKTEPVDALGHAWGEPTYVWSSDRGTVTAKRVCQNDPEHVQTETVETTSKVTKAATCTAKGTKTYTASFSNAAFGTQTKTASVAALGHTWGKVTYSWSKDLSTCTAKRVCKNDKSHVQTAKAQVSSKVTKKATATAAGVLTYTATFDAAWAKKQTKTASIDPTGVPVAMANAHVQGVGWLNQVAANKMVGTVGHSHRLEAFDLTLTNAPVSGGIEYQSHIQGIGWEKAWSRDGKMSGTSGQSKRVEAVRIRLYGAMAKKYDVYYRVHAQNYGWMGWAKNGAQAGTQGKSLRVEAMQVVLVKKGAPVPTAVYNGIKQSYSKAFVK